MSEKRVTIGHVRHERQSPHRTTPGGFTPLRLCIQEADVQVEVTCPVATVGRHSGVDVRLGFADISRRHCQFVYDNGAWRVHDLHSLNGVYVNNSATVESTLYAGDHVRVGSVVFLVLSATKVHDEMNDKLRQIADVLPE